MRLTISTRNGDGKGRPTRRPRRLGALAMLSAGLLVPCVGCGAAVPAARTAPAKPKPLALTSPSITGGAAPGAVPTIPVRYTCDGSDTTPSFRWGPVPPGTAELALFLFKVERSTPSANGTNSVQVSVEWAVAGLSPSSHAIAAGRLPQGAVAARKRYSICPAKGGPTTYIFQLNALSQRLAVAPRLDPARLFQAAEGSTLASGTFASTYKRA